MDTSDLSLPPSPFGVTPHPRSFYTNGYYEEGYGRLLVALQQRNGLLLLTGEPGTGKTTLLRRLSLALDETAHVTFLPCAAPTFQEILSHLCEQCCPSPISHNPWTQLSLFHDYLQSWNQHGGLEALFIDEAQHLSTETLEQLYLLINLDGQNGKLLQIVLAGHPELESMLSSPELRHVQQRIAVHHRLLPLAEEEVGSFIQYRLHIADCPRLDLSAYEAEQAIARYSGGIPRLINVIYDAAQFAAARAGLHVVTPEIIRQVAQTLQLQPFFSPHPARELALRAGIAQMKALQPFFSPRPAREPISKKTQYVPVGFGPEPQTAAQATPLISAGETNRDSAGATQSALPESMRTQRRFHFVHHWRQQAAQLSLTVILAWLCVQIVPLYFGQIEIPPQKTLQAERRFSSVPASTRESTARVSSVTPRNEQTVTPLEASPTEALSVMGKTAWQNFRGVTPLEASPTEALSLVSPAVRPSAVQKLDPPFSTLVPSPSQPVLTQPSKALQQQQLQMATTSLSLNPSPGALDNQRQLSRLSDIPSGGENFLLSSSPQIPSNASVSPSSSVIPGRASRGQRGTQAAPLTLASPWSSKKTEARVRLASLGLTANSATLYRVADNGSVNTVDLLLKAGVSPNSQNARGWTALMFAARGSSLDIVELLLARGAQPNMRNETGATALIIAARNNHAAIAQALLRRGATVNATDRQGRTALMHAAEMGHAVTARTLLNNGANPRLVSSKGWTALRYAAQEKRVPLASSQLHPNPPGLFQRFGKLWKQTVNPDKFDEVLTLLQQAEKRQYSRRG